MSPSSAQDTTLERREKKERRKGKKKRGSSKDFPNLISSTSATL